jgi:putative oxidoreductase
MIMATSKVHWGKPIWVTEGGAELPVTDLAVALTLALTGPGRFSFDRLFGIRLPRWLVVSAALAEAAMVTIGIISSSSESATEQAVDQQQAGTLIKAGQTPGTL